MARIQLKRGVKSNLPTTGMLAGEPLVTTDRGTLHLATDATTRIPVVPAIEDLQSAGAINGATDLVLIHDADAVGQKERKVTFDAFKAALAIPSGASDEMVAVVSGGAPGFLWGTDGTDGVLRMGPSMNWSKDAGNAFAVLGVEVVDGGTF